MAAKRTRKLLVWVLCLHTLWGTGQTSFQKTLGGPGQETGTYVVEMNDGYVIAGHTTNTGGNQDALLVRIDLSGAPVWQKRFGGAQADLFQFVVATPDGGLLAAGETRSFGAGNSDAYLIKTDGQGNTQWARTIGANGFNEQIRSIISLPGGGYVLSGLSTPEGSNSSSTVFVRLDPNGNTLWSRMYSSNISNILLANYISGNTIFAGGALDTDAALVQLDLGTGSITSTALYAGGGTEALYYQQPTQDGNLLLCDHTWSANTGTDVEVWVQKVKPSNGQVLWSKVYYRNNDNIRARIERTNDGGYLLTPYDNFNTPQADALLAKIDANGNLLWSYNYGGNAADRLFKSVQTADGGFISVGDTRSGTANGNSEILIIKTDAQGRVQGFCPRDGGIQSANFMASPGTPNIIAGKWLSGVSYNNNPLPITLVSGNFQTNVAPVVFQTIPLCPNVSHTINGEAHFAPKLVLDTVSSLSGCDTIYNYNLTLLPFNTGVHVIGLCPGETYEIDGIAYTAPATVLDTVPSLTGGCDTLCTYVLKMWAQPTLDQTIAFCEGESVMIGGQIYTAPGTVQSYVPSATGGCDTLINYTLIQTPTPTRTTTIQFCPGETVMIGGNTYTQSGTVTLTIPATTTGCDTLVTYHLELLTQPTRAETRSFCPGESVTIGGQTYTQSGTVVANVASATGGCDTIVTYTLELLSQPTRAETRSFCPGESVTIGGQTYTQPGTVVANIASATGGCDTIVTYTLELLSPPTRAETRGFCPGESVTIGGQSYTQPGTVVVNAAATVGCDTIITYTLQYLTPASSNVSIHCPQDVTVITAPGGGTVTANYSDPLAASDCVCPGLELSRTAGPASGSSFSVGTTQICYKVKDQCGQEMPCCFNVTVREEQPCDVKTIGCMKYELLSVTADAAKNHTYRIRVTNHCANKLIYTAIQVPDGVTAMEPLNNTTYQAPDGRMYLVRSPNYTPMYSIRFKSITDSIANGQSDIFEYTLPATNNNVTYINITSRLSTQVFYEAHLNTFYCPVGVTPNDVQRQTKDREEHKLEEQNSVLLFPNPTTGVIFADVSDWMGQKLAIQIANSQGQLVHTLNVTAQEDVLRVELPQGLTAGVYFFEVANEKGQKETLRFVFQR
ncbi:MAG: HYR domain-containing protein [Saprospiraceae bacterium]|nr:HYR domain-containing protein [Saprospiraceae bacterium]